MKLWGESSGWLAWRSDRRVRKSSVRSEGSLVGERLSSLDHLWIWKPDPLHPSCPLSLVIVGLCWTRGESEVLNNKAQNMTFKSGYQERHCYGASWPRQWLVRSMGGEQWGTGQGTNCGTGLCDNREDFSSASKDSLTHFRKPCPISLRLPLLLSDHQEIAGAPWQPRESLPCHKSSCLLAHRPDLVSQGVLVEGWGYFFLELTDAGEGHVLCDFGGADVKCEWSSTELLEMEKVTLFCRALEMKVENLWAREPSQWVLGRHVGPAQCSLPVSIDQYWNPRSHCSLCFYYDTTIYCLASSSRRRNRAQLREITRRLKVVSEVWTELDILASSQRQRLKGKNTKNEIALENNTTKLN